MADAVATNTLFKGKKRAAFLFTNVSDGTGESAVGKIDISTLEGTPSKVAISRIEYSTNGMAVKILFDHTTDDFVFVCDGRGEFDLRQYPLNDPASAGGTGDILFTTVGHTAGDTYAIMIEVVW